MYNPSRVTKSTISVGFCGSDYTTPITIWSIDPYSTGSVQPCILLDSVIKIKCGSYFLLGSKGLLVLMSK